MFNLSKSRIVAGIMMLCTTGLAFPTFAQDEIAAVTAAEQINSANELVRQGNFDSAIEQYQRVTVSANDRDRLNYNQAVAQFRKGDLEMAEALFTDAACSHDTSIAASSRYNLGNCWYAKALQNVEQDKPMAIEQLRQAIDHFRGSLHGNPDNPDARANIELAAELIKKLQEEQKQEEQKQEEQKQEQQQQDQQQQEQQQDQQQQNQQQQDNQQSQSENADSQNSDSEESESQENSESQSPKDSQSEGNEDQQQPDPSSESTSDDQQSQQQSDQSDAEEQNQSEPEESDQNEADNKQSQNEQSENEESDSQDQQNANQQNAEQNTDQRQPRQGSQGNQPQNNQPQPVDQQMGDENDDETEQQVPTGELTSAEQADENEKPNGSVAMADPNAKDGPMTKEEALKMLQAVRDSDMLRRLKRQQRERSRHVPVDRDW